LAINPEQINAKGAKEFIDSFINEAIEWCRGKGWHWRLPFLIWFAYVLIRHLINPMYNSILAPLNLGIHELGHLIFSLFGKFIGIAGGTILQCLTPLFGAINFYRQQDFFAIALCFGWLSTNLFDVARYVADARLMSLPLVAPFGSEDVVHDWNYLLSRMGLLQFDTALAFIIKCVATLSMLACLVFGACLIWQIKNGSLNSLQN